MFFSYFYNFSGFPDHFLNSRHFQVATMQKEDLLTTDTVRVAYFAFFITLHVKPETFRQYSKLPARSSAFVASLMPVRAAAWAHELTNQKNAQNAPATKS